MAYLSRWKWAWQRVKESSGEAIAVGVLSLILALGAGKGRPAAIGMGISGALLWTLIRVSWYASRAGTFEKHAPLLVVDYEFVSGPTPIPAGTKIRSIRLEYAEPEPEMVVISTEKAIPMDYRMGKLSWCLCTVRNQCDKRLLSGQLVFESEFFEGDYATFDNVRFKQSIRVSLPFIDSSETFEFYIMNLSGLNVSLTSPKTATVQLEGETHSRIAPVHASPARTASGSTLTFYT